MRIITKVLVGSRLHGLHNAQSDYDYRGVHMHDLKEVLSPLWKTAPKMKPDIEWIEEFIYRSYM